MASKQSSEKSALVPAILFGMLMDSSALLLLFFHFETSADELVDLVRDDQVTLVELPIDFVARIGFPDEAYDLQKQLTVSPERGIACLQKRVGGATHPRIFRGEHLMHV
jgi:hypothetical protein